MEPLVRIEELTKHFPIRGGIFYREVARVQAVDRVSFEIFPGETLGVVGESGCGKSTMGRTLLQLYRPTSGRVVYRGRDLAQMPEKELRPLRKNIQMIFQDPYESLNPRLSVEDTLMESYVIHKVGANYEERLKRIQELLAKVGLSDNARYRYPHEFSGGQRQRIGIARAIAQNPELIVCDEPVSALDVSIQSQILNLLMALQQEMKLTYVFISHDLGVIRHISDRIAVMYLGKLVEIGPAERVYHKPRHPYTKALISAIPVADPTQKRHRMLLTGDVPSPVAPPAGCRFHTRCPFAQDRCYSEEPLLEGDEQRAACHFPL